MLFPLAMIVDPGYMLNHEANVRGIASFYIPLVTTILIFLLNQNYFVPRCIFKKHYTLYFVCNLFAIGIALFLREIIFFLIDRSPGDGIAFFFSNYCFSYAKGHFSAWTLISFILLVCFVCVICVVYHIMLRQIVKAFIQREQKRSRVQYELDFLKNQLSPHFLFNTLNNISALIAIEPRRAEKAMTQLSSLLRITLYQTSDKYIPVKEDIEILKKYAELEKLRLDENFDFRFDVDLENPDCQIAPLISMPLMENSIKHSIGPHGKNFAHISIRQQGDQITFEAVNSNNPRKSKSASGGLGLATFIKRLELTYMDKYEYTVESNEKTYRCKLRIWGLSSL
jgi:two-component sensor histidine kinase